MGKKNGLPTAGKITSVAAAYFIPLDFLTKKFMEATK
jgi:hypothetical protein